MPTPIRKSRPVSRRFSPQFIKRLSSWIVLSTSLLVGLGKALTLESKAATLYWDADGNVAGDSTTTGVGLGGNGNWDTGSALWWDGSSGSLTTWPNSGSDTAIFTGAAGSVLLNAPISVATLTFNTAGFNLTGDGTAGSNTLTLSGAAPAIQVNVAGVDTISAVLAGSGGLNLSSTTTGTLSLTGAANTFSGVVTITSGTLAITADGSLGNAANDITFSGTTDGLTLATGVTLNSARTLTLTSGATATLTSASNGNISVAGQITGAGNLTVVNTGTTFLTNAANNFTGTLWVQSGTVSADSLTDAVGAGNIKLGNGSTASGFQWASGATSPLTLVNRSIELAGSTGGGTIDSAALVAADSLTINSWSWTQGPKR